MYFQVPVIVILWKIYIILTIDGKTPPFFLITVRWYNYVVKSYVCLCENL